MFLQSLLHNLFLKMIFQLSFRSIKVCSKLLCVTNLLPFINFTHISHISITSLLIQILHLPDISILISIHLFAIIIMNWNKRRRIIIKQWQLLYMLSTIAICISIMYIGLLCVLLLIWI